MTRQRTVMVLVLALASGGVAGYTSLQLLRDRTGPVIAEAPPRNASHVVVAARDLAVGALIGEEDVKVVEWPSNAVPDGYARSVPEVVGRGLITSVRANEPLLNSKMADRSGQGGLPIVIPEGMRAVSVRVDEVVAVAGFVRPGTRVDVLLTVNPPSGGDPLTKVVLQNVTVLAAGQDVQRDPEGRPVIVGVLTVLVTPEDGEKMVHAQRQGTIQLALRNMLDVRDTRTSGARVANLLTSGAAAPRTGATVPRPAASTPQQPQANTLEVYKGGVKALIRF